VPLGKGQAEEYELPARLSFKTNNTRQHCLTLWYVKSQFRVQITVGNLGMRSKGLIEYRKHESPLYIGFFDRLDVLWDHRHTSISTPCPSEDLYYLS
jgi:hypothetical protein